ncbi:MAG TPA: hypothetical protein VFB15_07290 [Candidatus Binataceae bacterium]|nr:hypothetical protein [Candidatus Binataceae bacterium]
MNDHQTESAAASTRSAAGSAPAREASGSFEDALARVLPPPRHAPLRGLFERLFLGDHRRVEGDARRAVAFDGFRKDLFDEKRERDRRYGTVYTVTEQRNAYLVCLELPRLLPVSGLSDKLARPPEMPDYDCRLALAGNVLVIKGSVPTEDLRRLSYVSNSFPADFMTRIPFATPVTDFVHRIRAKNLEVIVFKREA